MGGGDSTGQQVNPHSSKVQQGTGLWDGSRRYAAYQLLFLSLALCAVTQSRARTSHLWGGGATPACVLNVCTINTGHCFGIHPMVSQKDLCLFFILLLLSELCFFFSQSMFKKARGHIAQPHLEPSLNDTMLFYFVILSFHYFHLDFCFSLEGLFETHDSKENSHPNFFFFK